MTGSSQCLLRITCKRQQYTYITCPIYVHLLQAFLRKINSRRATPTSIIPLENVLTECTRIAAYRGAIGALLGEARKPILTARQLCQCNPSECSAAGDMMAWVLSDRRRAPRPLHKLQRCLCAWWACVFFFYFLPLCMFLKSQDLCLRSPFEWSYLNGPINLHIRIHVHRTSRFWR